MANINLTSKPFTYEYVYFVNGIQDGTLDYSLDAANTPVLFSFESDTSSYTTPVQASVVLSLWHDTSLFLAPVGVEPDDTVTIFGNVFTASSNPTQNQFFADGTDDENTRILSINSLAEAINSNSELNYRYTAIPVHTGSLTFVQLTAKYTGSKYTFIPGDTLVIECANNSVNNYFNLQAGTDGNRGQYLEPYKYGAFIELWKYNNIRDWGRRINTTDVSLVTTLSQTWNSSNVFTFNIAQYLNTFTDIQFPGKIHNNDYFDGLQFVETGIAAYYIKYGEQFNGGILRGSTPDNPLPADDVNNITNTYLRKYYVNQTETRWTGKGAFDLNYNNQDWTNRWGSPAQGFVKNADNTTNISQADEDIIYYSFLTEQPRYKLVRRPTDIYVRDLNSYELVWLYILNDEQYSINRNYRCMYTITFMDGTEVIRTLALSNTENRSGLFYCNFSYASLGLYNEEQLAGKRIRSYECVIQVQKNTVWSNYTAPIQYELDMNFEPLNYVKIWWRNKFGVYEQFEFEGVQTTAIDVDSVEYTRSLSTTAGYQRYNKVDSVYAKNTVTTFTVNTGLIDTVHMTWLRGMLSSNELYTRFDYLAPLVFPGLMINLSGFVAINVDKFEYTKTSLDTQYNVRITFSVSIPENNITD